MIEQKTKDKLNILFFILFTLLSITSLPSKDEASRDTTLQYAIIIVFILISIFRYGFRGLLNKRNNYDFTDLVPIIFCLVWLYGVFIGLLNNVPEKYVFRNFGGIIFYLIFYFFYTVRLNLHSVFKSIFFNAYIGIPIILYLTYLAITGGDVSGIGGERVIFCFLQLIILIPFVVIFGNFFFPIGLNKKYIIFYSKFGLLAVFFISYFVSVIISFSKGMILASFAIMLLIFCFRLTKGVSFKIVLRLLLLIFIMIGGLVYLDLLPMLGELFSNKEVSNATRSLQSVYLIDDLTFWGRGLGSGLTNTNLVRADDAPYAFELTYLNLLHKFGVMALFLFGIYIYTFWKIYKMFGNDKDRNFLGLICIGLMAYVFPSIGNPFLLSPFAVVCHCITLYIIKLDKNSYYNYSFKIKSY
ncbi:hypothetical protein CMU59_00995 [Elizabethkingia anophelis]|uniref:hypothetical protein n=1 Tax=Elizabethkingia anophelis TaxID=1117645 RepID=UPI00293C5B5C|nr:hypothetical protein [Elizabethkingia anophelis]MDV3600529.1 hypothetical protein [Elizabethkingia anophelis]MDV3608347.1 hypothetical protein [Elizabethkingia anophelis]MDV3637233.1 hypothetical protein [Elizabethkingia anophelis]MDV3650780.1 hypothetical protein [Elizabethkingia anophelis]